MIKPVSFANSTAEILDNFVETLRTSKRARLMARGVRTEDLFGLLMKEQASRTGGR